MFNAVSNSFVCAHHLCPNCDMIFMSGAGTEDVFSPPPVKAEPHTQSWTSYESIHQGLWSDAQCVFMMQCIP